MQEWLARVHHDLVKRLLWPARDRRDLGGAPASGELIAELVDDEGHPVEPGALWASLAAEAPEVAADALEDFQAAVDRSAAAAAAGDIDGVLALDGAFRTLAKALHDQGKENA
jgi:hypothetical protein